MNRYVITAITLMVCMAIGAFWWMWPPVTAAKPLHWVDEQHCRDCHQPQFRDWTGSHHQLAMQVPSQASVRGDFSGQSLTEGDETTTFLRQGDEFRVRISNPAGHQEFRVAWTFGWEPLQQYLLAMDDGRLQALGVAWDTQRQRWFHLYEGMGVDARHPLHWSKPAQNANTQCIECHSTGFQTGYDAEHDRFDSRWHAAGVGCQSCHGAASAHLVWTQSPDSSPGKGFAVQLTHDNQPETCARCHSRRTPLGDPAPHQRLDDAYLVSQLTADLYEVDGKISDEVFEHGSFLQSHMYQAGVVCSDCHNPHSGRLRAEGNAVCTQCHNPAATPARAGIRADRLLAAHYDSPAHHHHLPGSAGAECRNCHMPGKVYMGNDLRHDHSFSSPDPEQAQALGHSDACLGCHAGDQDADSLIRHFRQWYPSHQPRDGGYAQALFKARHGQPGAAAALHRQLVRQDLPALRRAALVAELAGYPSSASQQWLVQALQHDEAAVRRAAADNAPALLDAGQLQTVLAGLMDDPLRAVRISAAGQWLALADQQGKQLPPDFLAEYEQLQQQLAANAEAHFSLAVLYRLSGRTEQVLPALHSALRLNPDFAPAVTQLAQWQEFSGDPQAARRLLEQQLQRQPGDATLHHALGLAQIRAGQRREGVLSLEQAYTLNPDNDHHAYVLAIAWYDTGQRERARQLLRDRLQQNPASRTLRLALLGYLPPGQERDVLLHTWQQQNPQDPLLRHYLPLTGDNPP